jgi:predicted PurR-regulated permease PerM
LLTMLYIAKGIIVPLILAAIFAIVLHPVVNLFMRLKINRVVAIIITMTLALLIFTALGFLLFSQAIRFGDSWPVLIDKFTQILNQGAVWVSGYFEISPAKMDAWLIKAKAGFFNNDNAGIGQALVFVGSKMVLLILVPVYIFMMLFYQPLLLEFFRRLFGKSNRNRVSQIISQIKILVQRYLVGLLLEAAIVATLYSVSLRILGIEYALILGVIGALFNLIPYIGVLIAASLPMMLTLVSNTSPWLALLVLAIYVFIHFFDMNFIVPRLVGSKVKINALVTIIAVISFGALWGIPGMILSIPLTGIIKLILDQTETLKPWGFLLGDQMPGSKKLFPRLTKQDHPSSHA